jgi:hypothetical protein
MKGLTVGLGQAASLDGRSRRAWAQWLVVPTSVSTAGSRPLACAAFLGSVLFGERREHLLGGAEDREVPVAGVEVKLRGRYGLGI